MRTVAGSMPRAATPIERPASITATEAGRPMLAPLQSLLSVPMGVRVTPIPFCPVGKRRAVKPATPAPGVAHIPSPRVAEKTTAVAEEPCVSSQAIARSADLVAESVYDESDIGTASKGRDRSSRLVRPRHRNRRRARRNLSQPIPAGLHGDSTLFNWRDLFAPSVGKTVGHGSGNCSACRNRCGVSYREVRISVVDQQRKTVGRIFGRVLRRHVIR